MSDVAIVVGASSGLGKELATLLRSRGLDVVGVSRRGPTFEATHRSGRPQPLRQRKRDGEVR